MSTNCINCGIWPRTNVDLLCDECRRKRHGVGKTRYTVIGYYTDNEQVWMSPADADSPEEAAAHAVRTMLIANEWDEEDEADNLVVVEVIEGPVKGCLGNDKLCMGSDLLTETKS